MILKNTRHIGENNKLLGLSCDTLRYYEKIGLLIKIKRTKGGIRCYTYDNVSRLQFIQRAKSMDFTLDEIKHLLCFRDDPTRCSEKARNLVHSKTYLIEGKIRRLETLHQELTSLLDRRD